MSNQHETGNYDYDRLAYLMETREGRHTHYFGVTTKGRRKPLELPQARQARRDGVGIDLPDTALLVAREVE